MMMDPGAVTAITGGVYHLLEAGIEHTGGGRGAVGGGGGTREGVPPDLSMSKYSELGEGSSGDGNTLVVDSIGLNPGGATGVDTGHASGGKEDMLAAWFNEFINPGGVGGSTGEGDSGQLFGMMNLTNTNSISINMTGGLPDRPLSVKALIAILLGTLGLLANLSSLVAIGRIRNSLTANLRLIVSLCASDMLVSISILLKLTHEHHSEHLTDIEDTCIEHVLKALRMTSHIISLLNLVGLALDHYCAIIKPLNYPTLMCKKHANIMIVLFWITACLCGFSDFILPSAYYSYCEGDPNMKNYCMAVWCSIYTEEYIMFAMAIISSLLMAGLYTTIFIQIRQYHAFQQNFRQNMKRNKRGLVTTFVIVFTFMITWLPFCLFEVSLIIGNYVNPSANMHFFVLATKLELHFFNLLLLNSLLDPLIYAIRMREVQNGYRNIFPCMRTGRRGFVRGTLSQSTERSTRYTLETSTAQYSRTNQSESYL